MIDGRVVHDPERSRYEFVADGQVVGVADYRLSGDTAVMHHTHTDPAHRGQGVAAVLVAGALDDLRARNLRVVPSCWYVAGFIDEHPEYRDLVSVD
jgi:uncharacterized protein